MTDPIYTFIKGTGWVVTTVEMIDVTMRCGTKVRIERRAPSVGENYCWKGGQKWSMQEWAEWASHEPFNEMPKNRDGYYNKGIDFVTMVRL